MEPSTDKPPEYFQARRLSLRAELHQLLAISSLARDVVALDQSRVGHLSRMDAMLQKMICPSRAD